jgi:calpain-7
LFPLLRCTCAIHSEEFDINQTWDRIQHAHKAGEVLITLGTGRIHPSMSHSLGLVGEHDYAVLDLATVDGGARQLLIKDPWRDSRRWKGDRQLLPERAGSSPNIRNAFWIGAEEATLNFETMFLNWNPDKFPYRQDLHFTWRPPPRIFAHSLAYNRQFVTSVTTAGIVWILLSRHFSDGESVIEQEKTELSTDTHRIGFMSIAIFQADGKRVDDGRGAMFQGPFVDSPHTLARLFLEPGLYTVVPLYRDLSLSAYSFSLTFLSYHPLNACHAIDETGVHTVRRGAWTRRTAGGSASSPRYHHNPQFGISVAKSTDLSILLTTDAVDIAIRIDLVWSCGDPVETLKHKDLVAHSGDYERGCTLMRVRVDPGMYMVVCSTFSPGQLARFALRITSGSPIILKEVPPKAAGQLRCRLPPLVFRLGYKMQRIRIRPERLTKATVQINPLQTHARDGVVGLTAYKISVLYGWYPRHHTLAMSPETQFRQLNRMLSSHAFDMDPVKAQLHGLWILVEQAVYNLSDWPIDVEILCDHPVAFDAWESC